VSTAAGCSRIDTLRLAHANGGTPVEWPAGENTLELALEISTDGRPWLPVSVDGNVPIPFLLQASAGAIAVTGARAAGFGPFGAGRLKMHGELLPEVPGGLLIKGRRLAFDSLALTDQSLLLVEPSDWPHGRPYDGAAGLLGYDLLRRFTVEFDLGGRRLLLYRAGGREFDAMSDVQRLVVLGRIPYFEAWMESENAPGRWLRLQFEPGAATGICLDRPLPYNSVVILAGRRLELAKAACARADAAHNARDGVIGAVALQGLVVTLDYEGRRIAFRPRTD
jgi:hypothetical protein